MSKLKIQVKINYMIGDNLNNETSCPQRRQQSIRFFLLNFNVIKLCILINL